MDISEFMTWFIDQIVRIFTWIYTTLDSIQFWGTSLLRILITITIISALIPILLTIGQTGTTITEYNVNAKDKNQKAHDKAEGK